MKIAIIGAGYVGLVSAGCFAELGHDVLAVDKDAAKIESLRVGHVPIHEAYLPALLRRHLGKGLRFSTDIAEAFRFCDIAFICVGTPPSPSGEADLSYVENVALELSRALSGHKVIVEKSTVPVGTCDAVRRVMLQNGADIRDFSVASNPEFLREGTAVTDFLYPDRILLGVDDDLSCAMLKAIYAPILDGSYLKKLNPIARPPQGQPRPKTELIVSTVKSAELIKHASNAFLALKISFINAVSSVCERVGADVREVAHGMGSDSRIGTQFLKPGIGYGGSCFPKDVLAFRSVARSVGYEFNLLSDVMAINEDQKVRFVEKVRGALWTLRGKRLAVLGLAFKNGTDDVRDSPALDIVLRLCAEGAKVIAYDPAAMHTAARVLPDGAVTFAANAYDACRDASALLILTEWPEFAELDFRRVHELLSVPIVLDGKNLLSAEKVTAAGLNYIGVGTPSLQVESQIHPSKRAVDRQTLPPLPERFGTQVPAMASLAESA
jgi:UDPglucose 6-dehydrogenase